MCSGFAFVHVGFSATGFWVALFSLHESLDVLLNHTEAVSLLLFECTFSCIESKSSQIMKTWKKWIESHANPLRKCPRRNRERSPHHHTTDRLVMTFCGMCLARQMKWKQEWWNAIEYTNQHAIDHFLLKRSRGFGSCAEVAMVMWMFNQSEAVNSFCSKLGNISVKCWTVNTHVEINASLWVCCLIWIHLWERIVSWLGLGLEVELIIFLKWFMIGTYLSTCLLLWCCSCYTGRGETFYPSLCKDCIKKVIFR